MIKARVFISCGQRKGTVEVETAHKVEQILRNRGFEPYVAVVEQTLSGLKENIFQKLESSDYFIFIDFKREKLVGLEEHRGSLFSHQELAIASYLGLPVLAFQQKGVRSIDGMLSAMQVNPLPFEDEMEVADLVEKQLPKLQWNPKQRRMLGIEKRPEYLDANQIDENTHRNVATARFFHLNVHNNSDMHIARNCSAYISQCINTSTKTRLEYRLAEVKWAGITRPTVNIFPSNSSISTRMLDAFHVQHHAPHIAKFNVLTDSSYYIPQCNGPGSFLLEYTILSDNFPTANCWFKLELNNNIADVKFEKVDDIELDKYFYNQ